MKKTPPPFSIKDPAVISILAKLLGAARRAESEGKYLAMSKLMETANKISNRANGSNLDDEKSRTPYKSFFDTINKIKFNPEYIRVQGEIVE